MKNGNLYCIYKRSNNLKKPVYYFYYYSNTGKRIRQTTGQSVKSKAVEYVVCLMKAGSFETHKKTKEITFKEFSSPFWVWDTCPYVQSVLKRGGHFSKDYCKSNRLCMLKHISPFFDHKLISEITPASVNEWLTNLPSKNNIGFTTANKMLVLLKTMLDEAVARNLISKNPCNSVKRFLGTENRRGSFTKEQIQTLFSANWDNRYAYIACLLAASTGMRLGEVKALTVEQIHPGFIDVNASWSDGEGRKCTKSGKDRTVPICDELYAKLMEIAPKTGLIFTFDGKHPMNDQAFTIPLKDRMKACNIDYKKANLSFHSFRHFFNTRLIANNINPEVVRATIGHQSEQMTEHYLHLQVSDMQQITSVQTELLKAIV